jgi:hypothetical protein
MERETKTQKETRREEDKKRRRQEDKKRRRQEEERERTEGWCCRVLLVMICVWFERLE